MPPLSTTATSVAPTLPRGLLIGTAVCYGLSGAPALIDQVLWSRSFARVFGSSTHAVATVLAAFMAGLALGSFVASRILARVKRPLRLYALIEVGIALFAFVSLPLIDTLCGAADRWLAGGSVPALRTAGLFVTSFAILLVPTALMGATFPTLASLAGSFGLRGLTLELLYGANTLGAAAGALLSGFVLIPHLGFQKTLLVSGGLNLVVATAVSLLPASLGTVAPREIEESQGSGGSCFVLLFLATSGAITMTWEVVFSRLTAMVFGSSVYSFTIVVAAFLAGIGLGGLLYHVTSRRAASPGGAPLPLLAALSALSIFLVSMIAAKLPSFSVGLHQRMAAHFGMLRAATFGTMFVLFLPPALLLGMTFPAAIEALASRMGSAGRAAGIGTAVNTLGAAAGSIVAGFWLLPLIGLEPLLEGSAILGLLVALVLEIATPRRSVHRARRIGVVAAALLLGILLGVAGPRWSKAQMAEGVFRTYGRYESAVGMRASVGLKKLLYYRDGPAATVAVFESGNGSRSLRVNGKADASTSDIDSQTQLLVGHLPALLHPGPHKALVIGLGSGTTLHTLAQYPTMTHVDVAELEPSVIEAAGTFFTEINRDVLKEPNVTVHVEDGRRFVRRATQRYDIVVSEPSNPWVAGVSDLYTREHIERVSRILAPGGIFVQWIHGYNLGTRWLLATMRTVADVFPEVSLWFSNHGDFMVVASSRPIVLDLDRVRKVLREMPIVETELNRTKAFGARGLASRYLLGTKEVRQASASAPIIHDDLPLLEYFGPRDLYVQDLDTVNYQSLAARAVSCPVRGATAPAADEANEWLWLAESAVNAYRPVIALPAFEKSVEIHPLPDTFARLADYQRRLGKLFEARETTLRGLLLAPDAPDLRKLAKDLGVEAGSSTSR